MEIKLTPGEEKMMQWLSTAWKWSGNPSQTRILNSLVRKGLAEQRGQWEYRRKEPTT